MSYNFTYKPEDNSWESGSDWLSMDAKYYIGHVNLKDGTVKRSHYIVLLFGRKKASGEMVFKWTRVHISTKDRTTLYNRLHNALYGSMVNRTTNYNFLQAAKGIITDLVNNDVHFRIEFVGTKIDSISRIDPLWHRPKILGWDKTVIKYCCKPTDPSKAFTDAQIAMIFNKSYASDQIFINPFFTVPQTKQE